MNSSSDANISTSHVSRSHHSPPRISTSKKKHADSRRRRQSTPKKRSVINKNTTPVSFRSDVNEEESVKSDAVVSV